MRIESKCERRSQHRLVDKDITAYIDNPMNGLRIQCNSRHAGFPNACRTVNAKYSCLPGGNPAEDVC